MELRHIRYFIAVAENLSITRAAQQLMIAQPPLSRQIRSLEEELGSALFIRSTQGLRLTPEGISFLQYARRIVELTDRSAEHIKEMAEGLGGILSIASVDGYAPRLLAEWIAAFKPGHPGVTYTITNGSTDDVIYRVTNGLSEIGIITEPHNAEGLFSVPVHEEPWVALLPASDPLARGSGDTVRVADLLDRDLIIPSRESRQSEIESWFPGKNVKLRISCRISHTLNACELAKKGVGIAIYPASAALFTDSSDIKVRRLTDPDVIVSYILVWDRTHRLSRAASLFVDSIRESAGARA